MSQHVAQSTVSFALCDAFVMLKKMDATETSREFSHTTVLHGSPQVHYGALGYTSANHDIRRPIEAGDEPDPRGESA